MENKEKKYEFEKDSFILFILMMTANVINYVFQIVMGRLFNVAEYGELNSLFAIFTLVSLPMNALTLVVAKYVTSYTARGLQGQALGFIKKFFFYILFISVVLVVLGSTISPWLAGFIRTEDTVAIVFLFIVAGMATSTAIVTGSLQGLQKFFDYGLVNIINPLIKLVGSIFLVLLGLKINGVLGAMLMGNFVLLFLGYFILKKHFRSVQIAKVEIDKKDIFKYCLSSLCVNCGISYFTNIDVIIVKHYFPEIEAGLYSSSAVLAKMILYVSTAIIVALFPMVVETDNTGKRAGMILKKAFIYGGGLSVFAAIMLILLAKPMIIILYGNTYLDAVKYIVPLSLMIVMLSMVSILANYALALQKIKTLCISFFAAAIFSLIGIMFFNGAVTDIIIILTVALIFIFCLNVVNLFRGKGKQ